MREPDTIVVDKAKIRIDSGIQAKANITVAMSGSFIVAVTDASHCTLVNF